MERDSASNSDIRTCLRVYKDNVYSSITKLNVIQNADNVPAGPGVVIKHYSVAIASIGYDRS